MVDLVDRHHQGVPGRGGGDREERHAAVVPPHEPPGISPSMIRVKMLGMGERVRLRRRQPSGSQRESLGVAHEAERADRRLTIPNVISVVRLCCLPLFLCLLFGRDNRAAAAWLLAALGATDLIDGYIARRFDQVSDLGKILDPVADRLLFFVGVGGIMVDGSVPALVRHRGARAGGARGRGHARRWPRWGPAGSTSPGTARPARSA